MKQKVARHMLYAALTVLICLQMVLPFGCENTVTAEAASTKVAFVSSISGSAKKAARKAGAKKYKIYVANVKNYTNVYSSNNLNSSVKGHLYRGCAAYVIKSKGKFHYVSSGSLKGWVKKSSMVSGAEAKSLVREMVPRVATVTAADLNVREAMDLSSPVVLDAPKGTKFVVTEVEGKWARVRVTEGVSGYIYKKYAKIEKGLYTGATIKQEDAMRALIAQAKQAAAEEPAQKETPKTPEATDEQPETKTEEEGTWSSLGTFRLTAYCACAKCNGSGCTGKTASGVTPRKNHTIAVDRSVIPLGSKIRIGNSDTIYVAEDTGVHGKCIDVFHTSHSQALEFGVKNLKVYIYQE